MLRYAHTRQIYDYINTEEAHLILIDHDTWYIKKISTFSKEIFLTKLNCVLKIKCLQWQMYLWKLRNYINLT